jgi:hypothetical protein
MSQHFLLSKAAKTLSLAQVIRMTDEEAETTFRKVRWASTDGAAFRTEGQALSFIKSRIAKGTIVNADESANWNELHSRFEMKRINHEEAYSLDGACTNWAEEFFSRMRRAEIGHHHHLAGNYLLRYAQEASWREDRGIMSPSLLRKRTARTCRAAHDAPWLAIFAKPLFRCCRERRFSKSAVSSPLRSAERRARGRRAASTYC